MAAILKRATLRTSRLLDFASENELVSQTGHERSAWPLVVLKELVDHLAGDHDIPLLVLRDFDKSGFSIIGTLRRKTRRYKFANRIKIIDLGLRLTDVQAEGLESEEVYYTDSKDAVEANLRENGASKEEIEFLLDKRVELNAFASDHLVDWIERKLKKYGISKVVPTDKTLADAYRRMRRQAVVQEHIDKALKELGDQASAVPTDLRGRIEDKLKADPAQRWDEVLRGIADEYQRPSHDPHRV